MKIIKYLFALWLITRAVEDPLIMFTGAFGYYVLESWEGVE